MKYIIVGRKGSGKTTFIKESLKITKRKFLETNWINFEEKYNEGDLIIFLDTPTLLCKQRNKTTFWLSKQYSQTGNLWEDYSNITEAYFEDIFLKYVTELPNLYIINNNGSLSDFRVKIKKFTEDLKWKR